MITIANREYEVVCQLHFDAQEGLIAYDDVFSQPEDSDLSTYAFSVDKTGPEVEKIKIGQLVYVMDGSEPRVFEILRIESSNDSLHLTCVDGGLDLINEEKGPISADNSYPISYYIDDIRNDSGWSIGVNKIADRRRKLAYEGAESGVARLRRVANAFDAEIRYTFELNDTHVLKRLINIYPKDHSIYSQGTGLDAVRLEYGVDVTAIQKTESIEDLVTALYATGEEGVNLVGFEIPEGDRARWGNYQGTIFDKEATARWSRHGHREDYDRDSGWGYILGHYDSQAKSQETLYQAVKDQIIKRSSPKLTYEVRVGDLSVKVRRGDRVTVVDHDYMPALAVEAQVASVSNVSFADNSYGTITLTNVTEVQTVTEMAIERLQRMLKSQQYNWNNVPYVLTVTSTNGAVFQSGKVETTLNARVTKNDIDVTSSFDRLEWTRVSQYQQSQGKDQDWNKKHTANSSSLAISTADVEVGATFFCKAYKSDEVQATGYLYIKDFTMTTYTGPTAPENPEIGFVWIDTSNGHQIQRIYVDGQWRQVYDERTPLPNEEELLAKIETEQAKKREEDRIAWLDLQAKALAAETDKWQAEYNALMAQLQANKEASEQAVRDQEQRLVAVTENLAQYAKKLAFVDNEISFAEEGVTLKAKDGAGTYLHVSKDRIAMYSNGNELMSIEKDMLTITNGVFTRTLRIGNFRIEQYELDEDIDVVRYVKGGINA